MFCSFGSYQGSVTGVIYDILTSPCFCFHTCLMFELLATKTGARTNKSHACKYGFSCSVTSIYRVFLVYSTCYHVQIRVSAKIRVGRSCFSTIWYTSTVFNQFQRVFLWALGAPIIVHSTMKAMGQSLKSNVGSGKRVNPFHIKNCCIYQLTCLWNTVLQKSVQF